MSRRSCSGSSRSRSSSPSRPCSDGAKRFLELKEHLNAAGVILAIIIAARVVLWFAPTVRWTDQVFRATVLGPGLRALLRTPVDFLLTMAAAAAVVALAFDLVDRLRRTIRRRLPPPDDRREWAMFAATQLGAGTAVALLLVGYEVLLGNAISATSVDALHFSLHPLASARLAFAVGLATCTSRRLLVRHRRRRVDDVAVANTAQWRHRGRGIRAAGASRSCHLDFSARDRRRAIDRSGAADRIRRARVPVPGVGNGVGAAPLPPRVAGAAPFHRRARIC